MSTRTTIRHPYCFDINSGKTVLVADHQSIRESIKLLFLSARGEFLGDPLFGSRLYEYLFEPNDAILREKLVDEIVDIVGKYEKRISLNRSDITITSDKMKVLISMNYRILQLGVSDTIELVMLRRDDSVNTI